MIKKSTVVYIIGLVTSCLFVSAFVPSVFAGAISQDKIEMEHNEELCIPCRSRQITESDNPNCDTCREAVEFAVDFMKEYVKEEIDDTYPLWSFDVTILVLEGLVQGFIESGFLMEIDVNELQSNIEYWVNEIVGSQKYNATLFLARLGAITIGVTTYLLTLCTEDDARNTNVKNRIISNISWIRSRLVLWIILKHFLGLFF
jgi:hypothetical protein